MIATLELIVWVAVNLIGIFVFSWLLFISVERKKATKIDNKSVFKKERLYEVNKQIRNRSLGIISCVLGVLIGVMLMFGVHLPFQSRVWVFILIALIIIATATLDLYGELKS